MSNSPRRIREREARHRAILDAARRLAETEGWPAVTTRRLSDEIEFSQPVLYAHFRNRQAIVTAVAELGFGQLHDSLRSPVHAIDAPRARLLAAGGAYLDYARANPAVYSAMFELPTDFAFADAETPPTVVAGFELLREVVQDVAPRNDPDTVTEVFWSGLHGLAALQYGHRLRPARQDERVAVLVDGLASTDLASGERVT